MNNNKNNIRPINRFDQLRPSSSLDRKRKISESKRHTWTMAQRKKLLSFALKYKDDYKITSENMAIAIFEDEDFFSKNFFLYLYDFFS